MQGRPQGCFVCHGRNSPFQHNPRTCCTHKTDTDAYKKAPGSKKRFAPHFREAKLEVSKDELSKLMMVGNDLRKEIQEIKRVSAPKKDKDKDKVQVQFASHRPTSPTTEAAGHLWRTLGPPASPGSSAAW